VWQRRVPVSYDTKFNQPLHKKVAPNGHFWNYGVKNGFPFGVNPVPARF
jgi:hypothetical protein